MSRRSALALLLGLLALGLHLSVARRFEEVGAYESKDVLFDADLDTRLRALTAGVHLGIKHPNLMPYFSPAVGLIATGAATLRPSGPSPAEIRRWLGLRIVPLASALKSVLVFALFLRIGFSALPAAVLTVLDMVTFSTLVFGSVAESFGITAAALAAAYVLAASRAATGAGSIALWIGIGVFATGITITNVVPVTLLFSAAAWRAWPHPIAAGVRTALVGIAVFGITGVSAWVLDRQLVPPKPEAAAPSVLGRITGPVRSEVDDFLHPDPGARLRRFPVSLANAFAPPGVSTASVRRRLDAPEKRVLTLERSPNLVGPADPLGLSIVLLVLAGTLTSLRAPSSRHLAVASCGIVAFSWLLSVWGKETFLYSQHWQLASIVLLSGVMRAGRWSGVMTAAIGGLTAAIAINNAAVVGAILAFLRA